jgi:hypothetical protein
MSKQLKSLTTVAEDLDHMRAAAVADGHPMLALLLQLARDEAKEENDRQAPKQTKKAKRPQLPSNVIPFPVQRIRNRRRLRA